MKYLAALSLLALIPAPGQEPAARPLRANYLTTVADDFVVEVYHNGHRVPDDRRHLLVELFGASAERMDVPVHAGDWLVFHVVNNRMRWGGARFFAVAGCAAPGEFTFVSDPVSPRWSACDDPARVRQFIAGRDAGTEVRASPIATLWSEGYRVMRECGGGDFEGQALWGGAPSTWIKCLVE